MFLQNNKLILLRAMSVGAFVDFIHPIIKNCLLIMENSSDSGVNKSGSGKERAKRTRVACDECHKRRSKCDGGNPCSLCARNYTLCTITRKVAKRGPKPGQLEALEVRVKLLESILTPDQWTLLDKIESRLDASSDSRHSTGLKEAVSSG